jgi:nitrous oxide reductase accessory protein NosL
LTFATREWFDTWNTPDKPKGWSAGTDDRQIIRRDMTADTDWEYTSETSWMA